MNLDSHWQVLRFIHQRLEECPIEWVLTGSLGMVLQGMHLPVHDIDLQTDEAGAYEIERRLAEYVVKPVAFVTSESICSHLGRLLIKAIEVEVMGRIQKRMPDGSREAPVQVAAYRKWVDLEGCSIPVLSLEYEAEAYDRMGRRERASRIRAFLQRKHH